MRSYFQVEGGGGGLLLEEVLRNRSGSAYIWKAFASENEGFAPYNGGLRVKMLRQKGPG